MATLTGFLSLVGLAAIGFMFYVFATLSARLGAVTKMQPLYRLFWVGGAAVALAIGGRLVIITGLVDNQDTTATLLIYFLPLSIGLSVGLLAVWFYWRWLFRE